MTRRQSCGLGLGLLFGAGTCLAAPQLSLPVATDLRASLAQALARQQPLLVMASLEGCGFCHTVRNAHLLPLLEQGQVMVQIDLRGTSPLVDFDGRTTHHDALLRRWGVRVAPTLLFFGPRGTEVSDRLEGASLPDFYGAYLEERLRLAAQRSKTS